MEKQTNNKIRIKNLKYNLTLFAMTTSISLYTIASFSALHKFDEEVTSKVQTITIQPIETTKHPLPEPNTSNIIEIETLGLSLEPMVVEKEYSGMKLNNDFEDEIKRLADLYGIPYQIVLAIGEQESGGSWNNNGIISVTNDYGEFQINECNLSYIEENLGFTKEEILNDNVKNAEACMFLLKDIIKRNDVTTMEEIFGMYNGWVGWENKPLAVNYSNSCCVIMSKYFPDYEYCKTQGVNSF